MEQQKEKRRRLWLENQEKGRRTNKERYANTKTWVRRHKYYVKTYGITIWQFNKMLADQGGGCYICANDAVRLHVDHDHKTQRVRGLLCWRCNKTLGIMKDNAGWLARAVEYLERTFDGRQVVAKGSQD